MERPNYYGNSMVSGLLSEMMIDEQVRLYRINQLYQQIDEALLVKNKERFLRLTTELRQLLANERSETG